MELKALKKGQKIIYLALDFTKNRVIIEGFFLEEYNDGSERFYITTNKQKIKNFVQNNSTNLSIDEEIIIGHDFFRLKKHDAKTLKKYNLLLDFLFENQKKYSNATKYFEFRNMTRELFTSYDYNSKLFDNLIKNPIFFKERFYFHLAWKYFFGTIKQIFTLVLFLKDLIVFLYEDYFKYRCAKNDLNQYLKESKSLIMQISTSNEQRKIDISELEENIIKAREVYSKRNTSFFTLVLSIIAIFVATVFFTINIDKKNNEIQFLQKSNIDLLIELNNLKEISKKEMMITQDEINYGLMQTLNELKEMLQE